MIKLELLAPARDLESGKAAIDYGADALYVGGPAFGARYAATNTVGDIARLVEYARIFGVRVFVAMNTVLFDDELAAAEKTAREVIKAGVDALIVQDMAFMRMGLEGVEMHASTQMCNISPAQVEFLQNSGFSRVILERGLTLEQIREIRRSTGVDLECFIHGAICVGFSGRCYLSRSMGPRSGNRGECSQPCRLPYDLVDTSGRVLLGGKHLLSVQDMNMTGRIAELADAGITSFKIEGRLKEAGYVKNVVAHYRNELDKVIESSNGRYARSSRGRTVIDFLPDPSRTFTRGGGFWMADGKQRGVASFDTPKAMGAYAGKVTRVAGDWFETDGSVGLSPGDGICFVADGELRGTNVNKSDGTRIFPNKMDGIGKGMAVYRNYDHVFTGILKQSRTRRLLEVVAELTFTDGKAVLRITDEHGNSAEASAIGFTEPARSPEKMEETIRTQLAKSGDSPLRVVKVDMSAPDGLPFMPVGAVNELRRSAFDTFVGMLKSLPVERTEAVEDISYPYPSGSLGGDGNVTNKLAERFYRDHGVEQIEEAFDSRESLAGERVMTSAYCLRREIGECLKENPKIKTDLFMVRRNMRYRLKFDCVRCQMEIYKEK